MKVAIIIPAYNAEKTLADTLESLLAQTYSQWEAIVVDDGSTDATPAIAKEFAKRDKRIHTIHQANSGESAARNTGLSKARYEWILFLDADDLILPAHLERMTAALKADKMLDAVICRSARLAGDEILLVEAYLPPAGDLFPILARRAAFPIHACIVRRSLIESVGKFDTSLRTSPDWDLWQRIARTGARFGIIEDVLAHYRISPNSASQNAHQILKDGLRVIRQGHAPDPRVTTPHPDHANGEPPEQIRTQVFYLLSWCAGLLLGRGEDARPLLEYVKGDTFPELYPDAIAQCLFDSANLPTSRAPHGWEQLWPTIHDQTIKFLSALEGAAQAPGLADRANTNLKKRILKHSKLWQPVIEDLDDIKKLLDDQSAQSQQLIEEQIHTVEGQRTGLRELEQAKSLLSTLLTEVTRISDERDHLIKELRARLGELEQGKAVLAEQLAANQRIADDRAHAIGQLQAGSAAWEQIRTTLTNQLDEVTRSSDERDRVIADLHARLGDLEQSKAILTEQLGHTRSLADERTHTIEQLRAGYGEWEQIRVLLTNQLTEAQRVSEERDQTISALRTSLGELGQAKALLQEEFHQTRRVIDERDRTIEQQQAGLSELAQDKARLTQQLAQIEQLAADRAHTIDQQRAGIYELKQAQARMTAQLAQAERFNDEQYQTIQKQQLRLDELEQTKTHFAEQLSQARQFGDERKQTIDQQKSVIEELEQAQARLTEKLRDSQRMAEERAQTINRLQASLVEMEQLKGQLEQERAHWQEIARTQGSELEHLRQQRWIRLGRRLRLLQDRRKQEDEKS